MKRILFIATAVALIFSACTKEGGNNQAPSKLNVLIQIPNVKPATRSIGDSGVTPAIQIPITGGHIFVITPQGNIENDVALDVALATSTGQVLAAVPSDSRIYVLGNVPADVDVSTLMTLDQLLNASSDIFAQDDYTVPALGNVNGNPVGITITSDTTGEVKVVIAPLYSRIELAQVTGGTNAEGGVVTAFNVTGVWVDAWHPEFTMGGLNAGTIYNQFISTVFTPNTMGDEGTWAATDVAGTLTAVPEANKVWYHHVPAGGLPRLIIRVDGIKYQPTTGDEVDLSGDDPYYITVRSYTDGGTPLTQFKAGHIYKVGGAAGISFKAPDNIHVVPNPADIELTLTVEVQDWVIVNPDAELY